MVRFQLQRHSLEIHYLLIEGGMIMLVLITYDVNTETGEGRKRLRKVAKACEDNGHRVQNSVFECEMDAGQLLRLKDRLVRIIEKEKDSLRFYELGNNYKSKVEHFGTKPSLNVTEPLVV